MKIAEKIKRQLIKRYSSVIRKLVAVYGMELYLKDTTGFISKIYVDDDIFHLVENKNHLDGNVLSLIQGINIKQMNVCVDVGANLGFVSAVLSERSKHVIAFEPEPKNIEKFKELIKVNNIKNIEIIEMAVADNCGKIKFYTSLGHAHHSLGLAHTSLSDNSFIEVDVTSLDEFCRKRGIDEIDCLKVDVEGFEYEVFAGASEMFKNRKIKNVIFEISNGVMTRLKKDPKPIFDFLFDNGFEIYSSRDKKVPRDQVLNCTGQDLLAVLEN